MLNGRLSLGAEITNFELGRDGTLVALLDNEVIREWTSDPDRGQLRKVIQLDRLPQAIDVELKLELRDLTGKPVSTNICRKTLTTLGGSDEGGS